MNFLNKAIIALMPSIIGPILCMILLKTKFLISLDKPIDNKKCLKDGKRIFGDNKTLRGFFIYIISSIIISILWGIMCKNIEYLNNNNLLYINNQNTIFFNLIIGLSYGIAYPLFELPNSFIKRRLDINNKNINEIKTIKKYLFKIYDLIDSAFGCVLVLVLFYKITFAQYIELVLCGGIIHFVIIEILYRLKIKIRNK